jgi:hypothetical protein
MLPHARTDFSACGLNRLIQYATQRAMVKDLIGLHFVGEGTPVLRQPVEVERILNIDRVSIRASTT